MVRHLSHIYRSAPAIVLLLLLPLSASHAVDCNGVSTGMTPINDLRGGKYLGTFQGGLYSGGSNVVPDVHSQAGMARAIAIQPLDTAGNPDRNGVSILLSVGMSNTTSEFGTFMSKATVHPGVDHEHLVLANGAKSGQTAGTWSRPSAANYDRVRDEVLAPSGLSEAQVQAVWLKVANPGPTAALPGRRADAFVLAGQLGDIARALRIRYPNLKLVFVSSRIYAGYSDTELNPEPYAYESGFAVKWAIDAQIGQMNGQPIDPVIGDVNYNTTAPWLAWGPYMWADGLNPRGDGLVWECGDFIQDGTHPSGTGNAKVAGMLLDFFLNSPYTESWFQGESTTRAFTVITPNGGEVFHKGQTESILWTPSGNANETVGIRLEGGNQRSIVAEATPDDGEFEWTVPDNLPDASDYQVEVAPLTDVTLGDRSDGFFSIPPAEEPPTGIRLVYPNGGEVFAHGSTQIIRWSGGAADKPVRIRIRRGANTLDVTDSAPGNGHYKWVVPESLAEATGYVMEIALVGEPATADASDGPIAIQAAAPTLLTVTSPNGGETWRKGETATVTWTSEAPAGTSVRITLRNGPHSLLVAHDTPNDGTYEWNVVNSLPPRGGYIIEIALAPDFQSLDTSDATFNLR